MFELAEEALDEIALSVEQLGEGRGPSAVGFWWDVGRGALGGDQRADLVSFIGFVGKDHRAWREMVEKRMRHRRVMHLTATQAEPDREPLGVDDDVDLGREPSSGATETMISTPFFAVAACWCARTEVLSIIWICPS